MKVHSGRSVEPRAIAARDVLIVDVARGMSTQYMWRGQSRDLATWAEYCTILSQKVSPEHAMRALLCQAALAYVNWDDPSSALVQRAVHEAFLVTESEPPDEMIEACGRLTVTFARAVWDDIECPAGVKPYDDVVIACLPPTRAEHVFSTQFRNIYQGWS